MHHNPAVSILISSFSSAQSQMLDSSLYVNVTDSCCVTVTMTWAKHWSTRSRKYRQAENQNLKCHGGHSSHIRMSLWCSRTVNLHPCLCFCTSDTETVQLRPLSDIQLHGLSTLDSVQTTAWETETAHTCSHFTFINIRDKRDAWSSVCLVSLNVTV